MAPSSKLDHDSLEPQKIIVGNIDLLLINEIRDKLEYELSLVPGYDTDLNLMRWIVGYNRQVEAIIPKLQIALLNINALSLPERDFSSIEKVVSYCDAISKAANYLPGTLIGRDRTGNIVSLQVLGQLDGNGLMNSVCISDLYVSRIAESEGVSQLLREHEKLTGQQLGTVVIADLSGLTREGITLSSIGIITNMLTDLQAMFPDVLRKVLIINAPFWISTIWSFISPVLSKQTQRKIEFLGADWKEKLQIYIDKSVLFEQWGGTRVSEIPQGNVRMGGKIPEELYYNIENETVDLSDLNQINVPARGSKFVELGIVNGTTLGWWFQCNADLDFWVVKIEDEEEKLIWPKFRLLTSYVPEKREIKTRGNGKYRLCFGNFHGKIFSKDVRYKFWTA